MRGFFPGLPIGANAKAYMLLLIRDGRVRTFADLYREFGVHEHSTPAFEIGRMLFELSSAGLVSAEGPGQGEQISISGSWERIQTALGLSLRELSRLGEGSMVVTPKFGPPSAVTALSEVFVLMPFDQDLNFIYESHIAKCANALGMSVERGDDHIESHSIMSDVWNSINAASVIVADCSHRNPNVFYEIGVSHTLGKNVILIAQEKTDIPFDIRHLRHILYQKTPDGLAAFDVRLTDAIAAASGRQRRSGQSQAVDVGLMTAGFSKTARERLDLSSNVIESAISSMANPSGYAEQTPASGIALRVYRPDIRLVLERDQPPSYWHFVGSSNDPVLMMEVGSELLPWSPDGLKGLFATRQSKLHCAVLEGCFTERQAEALLDGFSFVVGIPPGHYEAGYLFMEEFYRCLAAGREVPHAFVVASHRLRYEGPNGAKTPALLPRSHSEDDGKAQADAGAGVDQLRRPRLGWLRRTSGH
jgi:hypothetical protein